MIYEFEDIACPKCSSNKVIIGSQQYTVDGKWVTKEYLILNPNTRLASTYPCVYIGDNTNIKCTDCDFEFYGDDLSKIREKIKNTF